MAIIKKHITLVPDVVINAAVRGGIQTINILSENKKNMKKRTIEQRVKQFLDEIDWMFQANCFERNVVFYKHDEQNDGNDKIAEIYYDQKYQQIEVKIWPIFKKKSLRMQRKVLLHELCHIITIPAKIAMRKSIDGFLVHREEIETINETETSKIENIIDLLLTGNLRYAKKAYANYLK